MMSLGLWMVVGWMAFVMFTGVVLLAWAWRSGQLANIEAPKYAMLDDREPEPWPERKEQKS